MHECQHVFLFLPLKVQQIIIISVIIRYAAGNKVIITDENKQTHFQTSWFVMQNVTKTTMKSLNLHKGRKTKTRFFAKVTPTRFKKFKDNKRLDWLFKAKKTAAGTSAS